MREFVTVFKENPFPAAGRDEIYEELFQLSRTLRGCLHQEKLIVTTITSTDFSWTPVLKVANRIESALNAFLMFDRDDVQALYDTPHGRQVLDARLLPAVLNYLIVKKVMTQVLPKIRQQDNSKVTFGLISRPITNIGPYWLKMLDEDLQEVGEPWCIALDKVSGLKGFHDTTRIIPMIVSDLMETNAGR